MADNEVVTADRVTVELSGRRVLRDLSFVCRPGDWTLLTGPSGAGKSTLLRTINGLCTLRSGDLEVLGSHLPGRSRREARQAWRQTGTLLQEIALFDTRSARGNVEIGLRAAGQDRSARRHLATEWLDRMGLDDRHGAYEWSLSGGQRQRVALARALAPRPRLLLLDEPTSALDTATARKVLLAIQELVNEGTAVVMSSHREDEAVGFATRRITLTVDESETSRPTHRRRVRTPVRS
jgi:D-methionine transport system ATP-binding protein